MNIAPRASCSSKQGTAHPPVPRQPSMREWLDRPRKPGLLDRIAGIMGKNDG